jgi:uncharacterized paraquat-inducible protein A
MTKYKITEDNLIKLKFYLILFLACCILVGVYIIIDNKITTQRKLNYELYLRNIAPKIFYCERCRHSDVVKDLLSQCPRCGYIKNR